ESIPVLGAPLHGDDRWVVPVSRTCLRACLGWNSPTIHCICSPRCRAHQFSQRFIVRQQSDTLAILGQGDLLRARQVRDVAEDRFVAGGVMAEHDFGWRGVPYEARYVAATSE